MHSLLVLWLADLFDSPPIANIGPSKSDLGDGVDATADISATNVLIIDIIQHG